MLRDQQCRKMPVNRAPVVSVHWGGQTAEVGEMPLPVLILSTPIERVLNECLGLLITTIRDFRPMFSGKHDYPSDDEWIPAIGNWATADSDAQLSCGGLCESKHWCTICRIVFGGCWLLCDDKESLLIMERPPFHRWYRTL